MDFPIPCLCLRFPKSCLRISLVITSIFMWIQGLFFLLLGEFIHNFLKNFFTDRSGLKSAGGFPLASICLGITMISSTFLVNYFVVYPTRNRYFMIALLLVGLFTFELITFITSLGYALTLEEVLMKGYVIAMTNYADGFITNIELNLIQYIFNCCGAEDFKDWYNTTWAEGRMQVPESCCIDVNACHNLEPVMTDDINSTGCHEKISSIIKSHDVVLLFMMICGFLSKFVGLVVSVSLGIKDMGNTLIPGNLPLI